MNITKIIKEEYDKEIQNIVVKASKLDLAKFINTFNRKMRTQGIIKSYKSDYGDDIKSFNASVASRFLNELSYKIGNGYDEVDFENRSKEPDNHFQMALYGLVGVDSAPFVYVDNNHMVVYERTEIHIVDLRDGDNYFEILVELK
jgi:hypothetical protein